MSDYHKEWYRKNKKRVNKQSKEWYKEHKAKIKESYIKWSVELKIETLSRYGKEGKLQCCWPECTIDDPDMLSLDHVNDDGAEDRRKRKSFAGQNFYRHLRLEGYPDGYQTLCMNHQMKKELMRRRVIRDKES